MVTLPQGHEPPEVLLDHLGAIAQMLGHALRVAERHTDVYREARRNGPLTLSAEMQWELMPGRSCSREEFELHAHGEPAYASGGHLFDWSASADQLTLVVANSAGTDAEAGLVNNLAVNAIRNARRAGLDLAGQAALADQALYGQHRGRRHLSTLLMCFDLRTGEAQIVDAGSPSVWRVSGSTAQRVELERQLPLGMFEDTVYAAQHLRTRPRERLLFVACGPDLPASHPAHAAFEQAVSRAITRTRHLPGADTPKAVLRELTAYGVAPDGGLVLSLDLRGP
ncbi:SpoIIE family protein phosphatase [Streptomyces sp. NPDC002992]|uniref:PP2C family protein-serine/threonine phosphatase n=1 Tax=Streptomyces sp. NPDC002992 TaxID=3154273 RepID=UPI0033A4C46A